MHLFNQSTSLFSVSIEAVGECKAKREKAEYRTVKRLMMGKFETLMCVWKEVCGHSKTSKIFYLEIHFLFFFFFLICVNDKEEVQTSGLTC